MTKTEFDIKNKVNSIIDELITCDAFTKMLKEIVNIMDKVDISDKFNYENQLYYTHLSNICNIIYELSSKIYDLQNQLFVNIEKMKILFGWIL